MGKPNNKVQYMTQPSNHIQPQALTLLQFSGQSSPGPVCTVSSTYICLSQHIRFGDLNLCLYNLKISKVEYISKHW